jgi:hyperosmotically inducible protein
MKIVIRYLIPGLALFAAAAPVSVRAAAAPQVVEKTEKAIVKGATIAVDKTKEGLSKSGEVITDEWITTRIHERFVGEDLLKGSDISVDTSKHIVTLKGTVVGRDGRARAERVAIGTEGVHRVVNHLTVGPKQKG